MTITVDFCRRSGGAFLAINSVVVAGVANGDNSARLIQSFEVEGRALIDALRPPLPAKTKQGQEVAP